MSELAKSTKRVKIFSIGKTEEGRDTMLVAVSDEANIAKLDRYKEITAMLADPRKTDDKKAAELIAKEALPFYWASGSIHSPRNRLARNADGTRLSHRGRGFAAHPEYPQEHDRPDHPVQ